MAASHVKVAISREMDTTNMFESYTVAEIRDIEKKTRQDIERKKEELRLMVGERYRDLIEAADTITDMKNCAGNVSTSITKMQDLCRHLKQSYPIQASSSARPSPKQPKQNQVYAIAKQIKLLLDVPEKVWSSLDGREYLTATMLFLEARHVHSSLQMDSQQATKIATWFPVLSRQWDAISHFRGTTLGACRDQLKNTQMSDKITAECLCSILLLEDKTPRQVFNEFLLARMTTVQQLFHLDQTETTIKSQVCDIVRIIVATIHQVYTLFYHKEAGRILDTTVPCNQLLETLGDVLKGGGAHGTFRPSLRTEALPIGISNLKENCQQWISTCVKDINTGLSKLLGFINTVKGLSAIRDDIWLLLSTDPAMQSWDVVCTAILNKKLSLWDEFFRQIFLERAKTILQGHFNGMCESSKQQVGRMLADIGSEAGRTLITDQDLSSYVWTESVGDVPVNMAWVVPGQRSLAENSTLMMKVKAYTPSIQNLCQSYDNKMKALLDDADFYLNATTDTEQEQKTDTFDRLADKEPLKEYLQSTCEISVDQFLQHLKSPLYACKQQLPNCQDATMSRVIINRVLLLGRLCEALSELSPSLQSCMTQVGAQAQEAAKTPRKLQRAHSKTTVHPRWIQLSASLRQFSEDACSVWSDSTAQGLVRHFTDIVLDTSGQATLLTSSRWDDIEIEEETEDGTKIKSSIRVPMQASWYLQSMLYSVCEELNRIGGHALSRTISAALTATLWTGVLAAYESVLKNSAASALTQNRSLQLLFDLRLLANLLPIKEEPAAEKRFHSIADALEGNVDPFDLDVFTPYVQTHLSRHTQRCNILYGALATLERHGPYMAAKAPSSGRQEQHNVLSLTTSQHRFSLLPLSTQTRVSSQPILLPPKPKTIVHTTPTPGSPPPTFPSQRNSSFLGQVSTLWFSNVANS